MWSILFPIVWTEYGRWETHTKFKPIWEGYQTLSKLENLKERTPSHSGLLSNEEADRLAKLTAKEKYTGT